MNKHNRTVSDDIPSPVAMLQMIAGFWVSRAIYVAAKLGIADLLKDQPKSSDELARATGTHAPSLYRVLRALASVGVFAKDEHGPLCPDASCRHTAERCSRLAARLCHRGTSAKIITPPGERCCTACETGEIAFDHLFGMNVWQYRAQHPQEAPRSLMRRWQTLSACTTAPYWPATRSQRSSRWSM